MTKNVISDMRKWGCDMDGALERIDDDEDLLCSCLLDFFGDSRFFELLYYLNRNDVRGAFVCAHTLKGVSANLGVTPIFDALCDMVEPLRVGNIEGIIDRYYDMMQIREEYGRLLGIQID